MSAPYGTPVTKMKSDSIVVLHELQTAGQSFDLVYRDRKPSTRRRHHRLAAEVVASRIGTIIGWHDYIPNSRHRSISDHHRKKAFKALPTRMLDSSFENE
jgi:hypothetical protein